MPADARTRSHAQAMRRSVLTSAQKQLAAEAYALPVRLAAVTYDLHVVDALDLVPNAHHDCALIGEVCSG